MSWRDIDDSSSFIGSINTTSTSSTVPGPGAIAGRFVKAVGETSLDLVVAAIIRIRLVSIQRTLERNPHLLRNPRGDKEWRRLTTIYKDLHELCRDSRSECYSWSVQKAAARLVQDITLITRSAPGIDASPTNEKWEALLARVELRQELLPPLQAPRDSISSHLVGGSEVEHGRELQGPGTRSSSNSSGLEPPISPSNINNNNAKIQAEVNHSETPTEEEKRKERFPVKPLKPESSETFPQHPSDLTRKVIFLGAGEVGKSTLVKQFQATINEDPSTNTEGYAEIIFYHVIDMMRNILDNMDPLDIPEISEDTRNSFRSVMESGIHTPFPNPALGNAIETLWQEKEVRINAIMRRLEDAGLDSANYFFDSAHRIFRSDYVPTHEDVVRSRTRTTGLWQYTCMVQDSPWRVIDTGGELSERKKWIRCFSDITAIFFVVALSDYNKTMNEDWTTNRMKDSLVVFDSVVNSRWFTNTFIVLLFNKVDEFEELLKISSLKEYYPDYTGENTNDACQYFEHRFLSLIPNKNRQVVVKYISAVNTEETHSILRSIQDDVNSYYEHNVRPL